MPSQEDERFYKTVIYMCAHSSEGAMGIIINKKIDYDLYPDLLEQLGIDKPLNNLNIWQCYKTKDKCYNNYNKYWSCFTIPNNITIFLFITTLWQHFKYRVDNWF